MIVELKSEALKDRHWSKLQKTLRLTHLSLNALTLGNVWDINLAKNERVLREILTTCQGEMGLEQFLKQLT